MRATAILVLAVGGACGGGSRRAERPPLDDLLGEDAPQTRAALVRELEADVLESYDRDELPTQRGRTIDPTVGGAQIGAGPDDLAVGLGSTAPAGRWPLRLSNPYDGAIWSKKLEVHVAADGSAGWVFDELSWRLTLCGKVAVIPLRYTALYAREGDRWVTVIEHVSAALGQTRGSAAGAPLEPAQSNRALALALDAAGAPLWAATRPISATVGVDALALGPTANVELRGEQVRVVPLLDGPVEIVARRAAALGVRGRLPTVAYWIGQLRSSAADGTVTSLRATLVFERVDRWRVVQAHVSAPIDDEALARDVFGAALRTADPLTLDCERLLDQG